MLLSELMTQEQSDPIVYGVDVDADILTPPKGLRQIGLSYKGTPSIDDELVDAIIAFSLAGVDVIVEIQPDQDVNAHELLTIAGNAGFSVALLPPSEETDLAAWCEQCAKWAKAFLSVPNFNGAVYPVSGYFGYLAAREASDIEGITPNDTYALERFVNSTPVAWSDTAKIAMHDAFAEKAGGAEAFSHLLSALNKSILLKSLDLLDQDMADSRNSMTQHGESDA